MKFKILSVVEIKQPFTPQGKNYSIYSAMVNADVNGNQIQTLVKTLSPKILELIKKPPQEFEADFQQRQDPNTGNTYSNYFIDVKKNENLTGGNQGFKKGFYQKPKITEKQYFEFVERCFNESKKLCPDKPDSVFGFILGTGCNNVTFETQGNNQNLNASNVANTFDAKPVSNEDDIPW